MLSIQADDARAVALGAAIRSVLERGATTTIWQAAALGLLDRVRDFCSAEPAASVEQLTNAFWHACRGGQPRIAEYLRPWRRSELGGA